jgi:hypothetical protein
MSSPARSTLSPPAILAPGSPRMMRVLRPLPAAMLCEIKTMRASFPAVSLPLPWQGKFFPCQPQNFSLPTVRSSFGQVPETKRILGRKLDRCSARHRFSSRIFPCGREKRRDKRVAARQGDAQGGSVGKPRHPWATPPPPCLALIPQRTPLSAVAARRRRLERDQPARVGPRLSGLSIGSARRNPN